MAKLWGGRFKKKIDPDFEIFSASLKWDSALLPYDLKINQAYIQALKRCGILSAKECSRLRMALAGIRQVSGKHEDVHSFVQSELKKKLGAVADKIHTGRSRNDLVAQSSRLFCKDWAQRLARNISALQLEITKKAEVCQKVFVPGMTHLQQAQVVSQAHILLSYVEMLERSYSELESAAFQADVCVLGSGALAGSAFGLDQKFLARALGLSKVTTNSYDVSGDRDFILKLLYALAQLSIHLSRIAEDLMIAQTKGYQTIDLEESLCTGSSMMPQKKNADFVELSRGASGVFLGNWTALATTLKGLPTSYNRDLQWDKRVLMESVETADYLLKLFARLFRSITFKQDSLEKLLKDESLYATDLADYLAKKNVPFHEAHEQVGKIVSFAEEQGVAISKIGLDILQRFAPKLEADVYEFFSPEHSVKLKKTQGSTNPLFVKQQIKNWKKHLRR